MPKSHLFVTVSAGPSADQAVPIIGISDERIVAALFRAIARLNPESPSTHPRLHQAQGDHDSSRAPGEVDHGHS